MTTTPFTREMSIQEVTRATGTTSRTLRHYDAVGLLPPSRVGASGVRYYDGAALLRLQRVLVLRTLGLSLDEIRRVLDEDEPAVEALGRHLHQLRSEQQRLERLTRSVERTITALSTGGTIVGDDMFDGFDHTQYRAEVEERWGARAYADSDRWWRSMPADEKEAFGRASAALVQDWVAAAQAGVDPSSDDAQDLARRHVAWLAGIPGTPGHGTAPSKEYVLGLGDMYVADPRFAARYGGDAGATFVRDALRAWAERHP